jgi:hypothetical protein
VDGFGNTVGNNPAAPIVDAMGNIQFTGYYGEYQLTIGGKTFLLDLRKGVTNYVVVIPEPAGLVLLSTMPLALLFRRNGPGAHSPTRRRTSAQLVLLAPTAVC